MHGKRPSLLLPLFGAINVVVVVVVAAAEVVKPMVELFAFLINDSRKERKWKRCWIETTRGSKRQRATMLIQFVEFILILSSISSYYNCKLTWALEEKEAANLVRNRQEIAKTTTARKLDESGIVLELQDQQQGQNQAETHSMSRNKPDDHGTSVSQMNDSQLQATPSVPMYSSSPLDLNLDSEATTEATATAATITTSTKAPFTATTTMFNDNDESGLALDSTTLLATEADVDYVLAGSMSPETPLAPSIKSFPSLGSHDGQPTVATESDQANLIADESPSTQLHQEQRPFGLNENNNDNNNNNNNSLAHLNASKNISSEYGPKIVPNYPGESNNNSKNDKRLLVKSLPATASQFPPNEDSNHLIRNRKSPLIATNNAKEQNLNRPKLNPALGADHQATNSSAVGVINQHQPVQTIQSDYEDFDLDYQLKMNSSADEIPLFSNDQLSPGLIKRDYEQSYNGTTNVDDQHQQQRPVMPSLLTVKSTQLSSQELNQIRPQFLFYQDNDSLLATNEQSNGDLLATASGLHFGSTNLSAGDSTNQSLGSQQQQQPPRDKQTISLLNGSPIIKAPSFLENLISSSNNSKSFARLSNFGRPSSIPTSSPVTNDKNQVTTIVVDNLNGGAPPTEIPPTLQTASSSMMNANHDNATQPSSQRNNTNANINQQQQANASNSNQWFNYPQPNLHQNPLLLHHILNKPQSFYVGQSAGLNEQSTSKSTPSATAAITEQPPYGTTTATNSGGQAALRTTVLPQIQTTSPSSIRSVIPSTTTTTTTTTTTSPMFAMSRLIGPSGLRQQSPNHLSQQQPSQTLVASIIERPTLGSFPMRPTSFNKTLIQMQMEALAAEMNNPQQTKPMFNVNQKPQQQQVINASFRPMQQQLAIRPPPLASQVIAAPSLLQEVYAPRPENVFRNAANASLVANLSDEDMSTYVALLASLNNQQANNAMGPADGLLGSGSMKQQQIDTGSMGHLTAPRDEESRPSQQQRLVASMLQTLASSGAMADARLIGLSEEVQANIYRDLELSSNGFGGGNGLRKVPMHLIDGGSEMRKHKTGLSNARHHYNASSIAPTRYLNQSPGESSTPLRSYATAISTTTVLPPVSKQKQQTTSAGSLSIKEQDFLAALEQRKQVAFIEALRASIARLHANQLASSLDASGDLNEQLKLLLINQNNPMSKLSGGILNGSSLSPQTLAAHNGDDFDEQDSIVPSRQTIASTSSRTQPPVSMQQDQSRPYGRLVAPALQIGSSPMQIQPQSTGLLQPPVSPWSPNPVSRPPVGRLRPIYPLQVPQLALASSSQLIAVPSVQQADASQQQADILRGVVHNNNISPASIMLNRFPLTPAPAYLVKVPTLTGGTVTASGSLITPGARLTAALRNFQADNNRNPLQLLSSSPPAAGIVGPMRFLSALKPLSPLPPIPTHLRLRNLNRPSISNYGAQHQHLATSGSQTGGLQQASSAMHVQHLAPAHQFHIKQLPYYYHQQLSHLKPIATLGYPAATLRPPTSQLDPSATAFTPATNSISAPIHMVASAPRMPDSYNSPHHHYNSNQWLPSENLQAASYLNENHHPDKLAGQSQTGSALPSRQQDTIGSVREQSNNHQQHNDAQQLAAYLSKQHPTNGAASAALARLQQATASLVELTSLASLLDEMVGGSDSNDQSPALALAQAIRSLSAANNNYNTGATIASNAPPISQALHSASDIATTSTTTNKVIQRQPLFSWRNIFSPTLWKPTTATIANGQHQGSNPTHGINNVKSTSYDPANLDLVLASAADNLRLATSQQTPTNLSQGRLRVKYIRIPVAIYEGDPGAGLALFPSDSNRILGGRDLAELIANSNQIVGSSQEDANRGNSGLDATKATIQQSSANGQQTITNSAQQSIAEPNGQNIIGSSVSGSSNNLVFDELGTGESSAQLQYLLQVAAADSATSSVFEQPHGAQQGLNLLPIPSVNHIVRAPIQAASLPFSRTQSDPISGLESDIYYTLMASPSPDLPGQWKKAPVEQMDNLSKGNVAKAKDKNKNSNNKKKRKKSNYNELEDEEEHDNEEENDDLLSGADLSMLESPITAIVLGPQHHHQLQQSSTSSLPWRPFGSMTEASSSATTYGLAPSFQHPSPTGLAGGLSPPAPMSLGANLRLGLGEVVGAIGARKLISTLLGNRERSRRTANKQQQQQPTPARVVHRRLAPFASSQTTPLPDVAATRTPPPLYRRNVWPFRHNSRRKQTTKTVGSTNSEGSKPTRAPIGVEHPNEPPINDGSDAIWRKPSKQPNGASKSRPFVTPNRLLPAKRQQVKRFTTKIPVVNKVDGLQVNVIEANSSEEYEHTNDDHDHDSSTSGQVLDDHQQVQFNFILKPSRTGVTNRRRQQPASGGQMTIGAAANNKKPLESIEAASGQQMAATGVDHHRRPVSMPLYHVVADHYNKSNAGHLALKSAQFLAKHRHKQNVSSQQETYGKSAPAVATTLGPLESMRTSIRPQVLII